MASWMVHLRVADELLRHLDNIDETAFVMGNIAPDSDGMLWTCINT